MSPFDHETRTRKNQQQQRQDRQWRKYVSAQERSEQWLLSQEERSGDDKQSEAYPSKMATQTLSTGDSSTREHANISGRS
jgi:hypothetical protein